MPKPGDLADRPTAERLMTEAEAQRASDFINERAIGGRNDPCQVCGKTKVVIQPSTVALRGGVGPENQSNWVYPSVITICMNCGFTRFFNAIVMGIMSSDVFEDRPEDA